MKDTDPPPDPKPDPLAPSVRLLRFLVEAPDEDQDRAEINWRIHMLEWLETTLGLLSPGTLSEADVARVRAFIRDEGIQLIGDKINYALEHEGAAVVSLTPPGEVSLDALRSLLHDGLAEFSRLPDGSVEVSRPEAANCEKCPDDTCPGHPKCKRTNKDLN